MGINLSLLDLQQYEGSIYVPRRTYVPFPATKRCAEGTVILHFKSLPEGINLREVGDDVYWWSDVQFVPYKDDELVVCAGAYRERAGQVPLVVNRLKHGILYSAKLRENVGINICKGIYSSSIPHVNVHPNGTDVLYLNTTKLEIIHLPTKERIIKDLWTLGEKFMHSSVAPNGLFIAAVTKNSKTVALHLLVRDRGYLMPRGSQECHKICPGFHSQLYLNDMFECKFSMNSSYIAVGGDNGLLIVVTRSSLKSQCNIVPGIFSPTEVRMVNERSFDFHPAFKHSYLTFASTSNKLHVCDIDKNCVETEIDVPTDGTVCALRYSPQGQNLAVATTKAKILLYETCDYDIILTLDGLSQTPDTRLVPLPNGNLPKIIHMSFSTTGEQLAVSSTDGYTRIWQAPVETRLQYLWRKVILQHVAGHKLTKLPIPPKLILFLLQWPAE